MSYRSWSRAAGLMFLILSLLVLSPGKVKTISRLPGFSTTVIYAPPSVRFLRGRETCTFYDQPFLIYKYAWGAKDFCKNVRYNAIKRFLNEKLEQIERENNLLRRTQIYSSVIHNLYQWVPKE
jgi:hypothetical protein